MNSGRNLNIAVALTFTLAFVLFTLPAYADTGFFSNFASTLMNFLFVKVGKILFIVFIAAGFLSLGKSVSLAVIFWAIAILFAVGSGLVSAVWSIFSSSATSDSGTIMYAYFHQGIMIAKAMVV